MNLNYGRFMRYGWCVLISVLLISCKSQNTENFDWILGEWVRTNEAAGKVTTEKWKMKSESMYLGEGLTLKGNDTTFHENMKLWKSDDGWCFDVQTPNEVNPTKFKLTHIGEGAFTCENPENEFPKVIKYFKEGEMLKAEISAGEMEVAFEFERK